jgi:hypothetical protein
MNTRVVHLCKSGDELTRGKNDLKNIYQNVKAEIKFAVALGWGFRALSLASIASV